MHSAAEEVANTAQRRYLLLARCAIVLPLLAVAFGTASGLATWLGVASAVTVGMLALTRIIQRSSHAEPAWYEARATAEAIKALTWQYAVRAAPFDRDEDEETTDERFVALLRSETEDDAEPLLPDARGEITASMRSLRAAPLDRQREAYTHGRIIDQMVWYRSRAKRAKAIAGRLDVLHYVFDAVAVGASLLLIGDVSADVSRAAIIVASSAAGAALAWSGVRRYSSLSRQYAGVALELDLLNERARHADTPAEWRSLVQGVEEALAAEHSQWRVSRGMSMRFSSQRSPSSEQ